MQNAARPASATSSNRYLPRSTPSTSEYRSRRRLPFVSMSRSLARGGSVPNDSRARRAGARTGRGVGHPVGSRTVFDVVLETERLRLRPYRPEDLDDLAAMFGDPEHMRWYPAPFTREETQAWMDRQGARYREDGSGCSSSSSGRTAVSWGRRGPRSRTSTANASSRSAGTSPRRSRGGASRRRRGRRHATGRSRTPTSINVIWLIRPENVGSVRVAEKLGFRTSPMVCPDQGWR